MRRAVLRIAIDLAVGGACIAVGALALGAILLMSPTAERGW